MNLHTKTHTLWSLVIISCCLILAISTATYAQKSFDDAPSTDKPAKKAPTGGKGFDDVGDSKSNSKPVGKSLDAIDPKAGKVKADNRGIIKIGPHAEETAPVPSHKVTPKPRPENVKEEPKKPQEDEVDVATQYPEMLPLGAGSFLMGSNNGQPNEGPSHTVKVSAFEIGKYEVTNNQFRAFVKATGYKTVAELNDDKLSWKDYAVAGRGRYPVVMITYEDAQKYCEWLSAQTNATYRLPTEAEWEYAARGGKPSQLYPWGDKIEVTQANYAGDSNRQSYAEPALDFIQPVGNYAANGFGLYDVIGNVAEWCSDKYSADFYNNSPVQDPQGVSEGSFRVVRGGGWGNAASYCSVTFRKPSPGIYRSSAIGFRVVKVLAKTAPANKADEKLISNSDTQPSQTSGK